MKVMLSFIAMVALSSFGTCFSAPHVGKLLTRDHLGKNFLSTTTSEATSAPKPACSVSVTSTVKTNADGSTTRTTVAKISCDTPEELATLMKIYNAL
jgi:hypothetical protein